MNLDLLTKLVKLANNNPNEHEANSAARRVCKLIAEADFKFVSNDPAPSGWDKIQEEMRKAQASNVRSASNPISSDWFKRYYYGSPQDHPPWHNPIPNPEPPKPKEPPVYTEPPRYPNLDDLVGEMFGNKQYPGKKKNFTNRECSKCHNKVETPNEELVFVCAACKWNEYQANTSSYDSETR